MREDCAVTGDSDAGPMRWWGIPMREDCVVTKGSGAGPGGCARPGATVRGSWRAAELGDRGGLSRTTGLDERRAPTARAACALRRREACCGGQ